MSQSAPRPRTGRTEEGSGGQARLRAGEKARARGRGDARGDREAALCNGRWLITGTAQPGPPPRPQSCGPQAWRGRGKGRSGAGGRQAGPGRGPPALRGRAHLAQDPRDSGTAPSGLASGDLPWPSAPGRGPLASSAGAGSHFLIFSGAYSHPECL